MAASEGRGSLKTKHAAICDGKEEIPCAWVNSPQGNGSMNYWTFPPWWLCTLMLIFCPSPLCTAPGADKSFILFGCYKGRGARQWDEAALTSRISHALWIRRVARRHPLLFLVTIAMETAFVGSLKHGAAHYHIERFLWFRIHCFV